MILLSFTGFSVLTNICITEVFIILIITVFIRKLHQAIQEITGNFKQKTVCLPQRELLPGVGTPGVQYLFLY